MTAPGKRTRGEPRSLFLVLAVAGVLAAILTRFWGAPPLSADSWTYYELSRTIWDGFTIDTWRSYLGPVEHGSSFPYAWPLLLWFSDTLTGLGVRSSLVANTSCVLASGALLAAASRGLGVSRTVGWLAILGLLSFPPFVDEIAAGRAFPLTVLTVSLAAYAIVNADKRRLSWRDAVYGAALAAPAVVRSDLLPVCLIALLVVTVHWRNAQRAVVALAGVALVLAPQVVYSLAYFDVVWISDNGRVATAAGPAFVTDVPSADALTIADSPGAWLSKLGTNAIAAVRVPFDNPQAFVFPSALALLSLASLSACACRWHLRVQLAQARGRYWLLGVLGLGLHTLLTEAATGYFDLRYWSLVVLLVMLGSALVLASASTRWRVAAACLALTGAVYAVVGQPPAAPLQLAIVDDVERCAHLLGGTVILTGNNNELRAATQGARTNVQTGMAPRNLGALSVEEIQAWLTAFNIRGFYDVAGGTSTDYLTPVERAVGLQQFECSERDARVYSVAPD